MDYNEISKLISEKSTALGQRYAELPKLESGLRDSMFGNDAVMGNLNTQEKTKIDELFSHDQNVANQYQQNPGLSSSPSGRVLDPYARELALSNRYKGTANDLTEIRQKRDTRRDVIGDSLANALKLATQSLEMKKLELDQLQKDRDFAWDVYKEKNKGSGGQGNVSALFDAIMGLKQRQKESAPSASGTAKDSRELSTIRKKYGQVNYTKNKDGSYSWAVPGKLVTAEEGDPDTINKLAAASIAKGGSTSDVAALLQLLGESDNYLSPSKRSTDFQAKLNEAQSGIDSLRRSYASEEEVQAKIEQIVQRAPELSGYIK